MTRHTWEDDQTDDGGARLELPAPALAVRPEDMGISLAPFAERIGNALQTVIHEALVLDEIDAQVSSEDRRTGRLRDACQGLWQASTAISDTLLSLDSLRACRAAE